MISTRRLTISTIRADTLNLVNDKQRSWNRFYSFRSVVVSDPGSKVVPRSPTPGQTLRPLLRTSCFHVIKI